MALVNSFQGYIFDYGGVLVEHQTAADQDHLANIAGLPKDRFFELYWAHRLEYDRGDLSRLEYWQALAAAAGKQFTLQTIADLAELDTTSWMRFDAPMWEWLSELRRAGKRVAMLSNMPQDLGDALRSRTERLRVFDCVTLSCEIRAVKPDAAAYEHCLAALGTPPEETVFFDDRLANVQGAERLGMHAIQFTNREDAVARLL
jgi:putative hydrolase of the HAD superfamily